MIKNLNIKSRKHFFSFDIIIILDQLTNAPANK